MSLEARVHVSQCEHCGVLLRSAREFQSSLQDEAAVDPTLEPSVGSATLRAEREVVRTRRYSIALRVVTAIVMVGILLGSVALILGLPARDLGVAAPVEQLVVLFAGIVVATLAAIPILVLFGVTRAIVRPSSGRPLYKRLGPGRVLSGVALGIAEAARLNVSVVRLLFFGLFFFDGLGLLLYILLTLFMPVHPEERQYLLRFRLRRWLRSPSTADGR